MMDEEPNDDLGLKLPNIDSPHLHRKNRRRSRSWGSVLASSGLVATSHMDKAFAESMQEELSLTRKAIANQTKFRKLFPAFDNTVRIALEDPSTLQLGSSMHSAPAPDPPPPNTNYHAVKVTHKKTKTGPKSLEGVLRHFALAINDSTLEPLEKESEDELEGPIPSPTMHFESRIVLPAIGTSASPSLTHSPSTPVETSHGENDPFMLVGQPRTVKMHSAVASAAFTQSRAKDMPDAKNQSLFPVLTLDGGQSPRPRRRSKSAVHDLATLVAQERQQLSLMTNPRLGCSSAHTPRTLCTNSSQSTHQPLGLIIDAQNNALHSKRQAKGHSHDDRLAQLRSKHPENPKALVAASLPFGALPIVADPVASCDMSISGPADQDNLSHALDAGDRVVDSPSLDTSLYVDGKEPATSTQAQTLSNPQGGSIPTHTPNSHAGPNTNPNTLDTVPNLIPDFNLNPSTLEVVTANTISGPNPNPMVQGSPSLDNEASGLPLIHTVSSWLALPSDYIVNGNINPPHSTTTQEELGQLPSLLGEGGSDGDSINNGNDNSNDDDHQNGDDPTISDDNNNGDGTADDDGRDGGHERIANIGERLPDPFSSSINLSKSHSSRSQNLNPSSNPNPKSNAANPTRLAPPKQEGAKRSPKLARKVFGHTTYPLKNPLLDDGYQALTSLLPKQINLDTQLLPTLSSMDACKVKAKKTLHAGKEELKKPPHHLQPVYQSVATSTRFHTRKHVERHVVSLPDSSEKGPGGDIRCVGGDQGLRKHGNSTEYDQGRAQSIPLRFAKEEQQYHSLPRFLNSDPFESCDNCYCKLVDNPEPCKVVIAGLVRKDGKCNGCGLAVDEAYYNVEDFVSAVQKDNLKIIPKTMLHSFMRNFVHPQSASELQALTSLNSSERWMHDSSSPRGFPSDMAESPQEEHDDTVSGTPPTLDKRGKKVRVRKGPFSEDSVSTEKHSSDDDDKDDDYGAAFHVISRHAAQAKHHPRRASRPLESEQDHTGHTVQTVGLSITPAGFPLTTVTSFRDGDGGVADPMLVTVPSTVTPSGPATLPMDGSYTTLVLQKAKKKKNLRKMPVYADEDEGEGEGEGIHKARAVDSLLNALVASGAKAVKIRELSNDSSPSAPDQQKAPLFHTSNAVSPLEFLEQHSLLPPSKLLSLRSIFLDLDDDGDYLLTPNELFRGLQQVTKFAITDGQVVFLIEIVEMAPKTPKDIRAHIEAPCGSFPDRQMSLALPVNFSHVTFKQFALLSSLAQQICALDPNVKEQIQGLDPVNLRENLGHAKDLFRLNSHLSELPVITLDELSIEMKSAGTFSPEMEASILETLQNAGLPELTYMDFCLCKSVCVKKVFV